ncbi:MAG: histidine kinase [Bacteroidetes bacterium]|nr:histidine kinase [Bacteroidota bacterium]
MFPLQRAGLQTRIVLLSVLSTLVMLAVFGISSVLAVNDSIDRTLHERLVLAQTAADMTDRVLSQNLQFLQDVAIDPTISMDQPDSEPAQQALRDAYFHSIFGDGVYILDSKGIIRWMEPTMPDEKRRDLSSYSHVREALQTAKPLVSNVYYTADTHRPVVSLLYPILDSRRQVVGLVGGDIDVTGSDLAGIIQPVRVGKTGYSQIVDGNGIVVASGRQQDTLQESDHGNFLAGLIKNKQTSMGTCHDCHETPQKTQRQTEVMAFAPLSTASWGIAIRQSQDEALAPTEQLRQQFILFSIAMMLLALLLAWAIAQSVVRPVRALTGAAERIAAGKLDEPISPAAEDEIGKLARTFDEMRLRLKESMEKVQQWNRQLESSVQLRTRELKESQEQLVRRNMELSLMNAIGGAMSQSMKLDTILKSALDEVVNFMRAEAGMLTLFAIGESGEEKSVYLGISAGVIDALAQLGPCRRLVAGSEQRCEENLEPCVLRDAVARVWPASPGGYPPSIACVHLASKGKVLGTLCMATRARDFSVADRVLLSSVGQQIAVAVENAILYQELEHKEALRGELLRKVISAQEEERKRIARELHDDTSQALAALALALETASVAPARDVDEVKARIGAIKPRAVGILEEVRKLTLDLRPTVLDDLGLIPAIRWYGENRLKGQGVKVHLETAGDERRLPPELETTLFRVVQEALSNIARHAKAHNVFITLDFSSSKVVIEVEDDGEGFDLTAVSKTTDRERGLGLMGMLERVALFSGTMVIETAPGAGTQLRIEVPIEGARNGQN